MDPITADLILTTTAAAALLMLGAIAVAVLPWTDRDLVASARAWQTLGALVLLPVLRALRGPTSAPVAGAMSPALPAPERATSLRAPLPHVARWPASTPQAQPAGPAPLGGREAFSRTLQAARLRADPITLVPDC